MNNNHTDTEKSIQLNIVDDAQVSQKISRQFSLKNLYNSVNDWLIGISSVPVKHKFIFFDLLSSMIGAGISLVECFNLLESNISHPRLKQIAHDISISLQNGEKLSDAFRLYKDVFDESICSVIESGERSGKLETVMKEIVRQYGRLNEISSKVRSVMIYPIIVFSVMILASVIILVFVIPKLESLFNGTENLPLPTRILISMSDFLINYWLSVFVVFVALILGFITWKKSRSGSQILGEILLRIPIIGSVFHHMILTQFSRIFGFLLSSGTPVVASLQITSNAISNPTFKQKIYLAADDVSRGLPITESFSGSESLFPKILLSLISIGEQSAQLDSAMLRSAKLYEEELDRKIQALSKFIEPFVLVVLTSLALFLILAIYLPILQLGNNLS